jgi:ABC-type lipoprotein release transport system permease subunit
MVASAFIVRYVRAMLFDVRPLDVSVIAAVCLAVLGVAAVSAIFPALRATAIDPMEALRTE